MVGSLASAGRSLWVECGPGHCVALASAAKQRMIAAERRLKRRVKRGNAGLK
jgi:hypothetical protein